MKTVICCSREKKKEAYQWKPQNPQAQVTEPVVSSPKRDQRSSFEYEKTPELAAKIAQESQQRDEWAAEIAKMPLPKLVQQLALNAHIKRRSVKKRSFCIYAVSRNI